MKRTTPSPPPKGGAKDASGRKKKRTGSSRAARAASLRQFLEGSGGSRLQLRRGGLSRQRRRPAAKFKAETRRRRLQNRTSPTSDACPRRAWPESPRISARSKISVNNAGVTPRRHVPQDDARPMVRRHQHQTSIRCSICPVPVMRACASAALGRIVNISSINGQKGQMGQVNYSASKAGDIGFTKALAQEERRQGNHRQRDLPRLHRHRNGDGRCRKRCWRRRSCRRSRCADSASRRKSRASSSSSPADEFGFITGSTLTINGGQYMV